MSLIQRLQVPDRPKIDGGYSGPRVAVIYGFMARRLMQRNLLHYLRSKGLSDVTMYGHMHSVESISDDLQASRDEGRNLVILGYSQGGFQAVKAARELERRGVDVALLVSIAAGGLGRVFPGRWGFDPRKVPTNVDVCLNFFAKGDLLGCDRSHQKNEAFASRASQRVENHMFHADQGVSHTDLVRCYPEEAIKPAVREHVIERLLVEISGLKGSDTQQGGQADSGKSEQLLFPESSPESKVTVTRVTIPPGATSPRHVHETSEQVWIALSGHGILLLADEYETQFREGDVLRLAPGDVHGFSTTSSS